jgi:hypothetical protein
LPPVLSLPQHPKHDSVASRYKTDAGMLYPVPDRRAKALHSKLR